MNHFTDCIGICHISYLGQGEKNVPF